VALGSPVAVSRDAGGHALSAAGRDAAGGTPHDKVNVRYGLGPLAQSRVRKEVPTPTQPRFDLPEERLDAIHGRGIL